MADGHRHHTLGFSLIQPVEIPVDYADGDTGSVSAGVPIGIGPNRCWSLIVVISQVGVTQKISRRQQASKFAGPIRRLDTMVPPWRRRQQVVSSGKSWPIWRYHRIVTWSLPECDVVILL